ncbi:MAG: gamma-glutamyltransferase family protein [Candidatus Solibacter usitatus]|nr:gamma-glutamyltransferase family protein [Candidatus Solibacter usitatus]
MVASGDTYATDVGLAVLQRGGNAVDAAVAMSFVLSVTHSAMCGLGGGGNVLVRTRDGRFNFFDFREQAPASASRDMFKDANGQLTGESVTGWRAAATPGHVAGMSALHKQHGQLPWRELLMPATVIAAQGHAVTWQRAESMRQSEALHADPESTRVFLNNGKYLEPDELHRQPELAATLERIANNGAEEFYLGETASKLATAMSAHGGHVTLEDLRTFRVSTPQPLRGSYRGFDVTTAAGSSSGGLGLLQMLGLIETADLPAMGCGSATSIGVLVEAMRRSFADRAEYFGDPEFVSIPYEKLLSAKSGNTTHYGVVDAAGNAVAATITLNMLYGSGVTVPGLGFLLNNNMDNFAANPGGANQYGLVQGEANAIAPRKRPASSMTPTIVEKDGRLHMVIGTPGGPTIVSAVLQGIVNVIDFGHNAQQAINTPRVHHQWRPDVVFVEPGFSPDTLAILREKGYRVELRGSNNDMNLILAAGEWLEGAVDPRREGKAAGY